MHFDSKYKDVGLNESFSSSHVDGHYYDNKYIYMYGQVCCDTYYSTLCTDGESAAVPWVKSYPNFMFILALKESSAEDVVRCGRCCTYIHACMPVIEIIYSVNSSKIWGLFPILNWKAYVHAGMAIIILIYDVSLLILKVYENPSTLAPWT